MEVIKCGLCKEEIKYAQRCRVYIKSSEPRLHQRISKRPHIGRFKLISTAKSTEHISFARRLKRLRAAKNNKNTKNNSTDSLSVDQKAKSSLKNKGDSKEPESAVEDPEKKTEFLEKSDTEDKPVSTDASESSSKSEDTPIAKAADSSIETSSERNLVDEVFELKEKLDPEVKLVKKLPDSPKKIVKKFNISKPTYFVKKVIKSKSSEPQTIKKLSPGKGPIRKNMNHPHFQSSFEEYIKPSLPKNNSTPIANKDRKRKNSDISSSDFDQHKKLPSSTPRILKNGPINNSKNSDCETYYWLEMPKPKQPEFRRLGYNFDSLVTEVKHMKLPNPDWKIKIMVHKQEMVSVSFTKKMFPEKIVSVNAKSAVCDIAMDGKKIILLGSPTYIHSIKDLEIMLDIVNDIELDSPMITYLKSVV